MVEIEILQSSSLWVLDHTDSTTSIDEKDGGRFGCLVHRLTFDFKCEDNEKSSYEQNNREIYAFL